MTNFLQMNHRMTGFLNRALLGVAGSVLALVISSSLLAQNGDSGTKDDAAAKSDSAPKSDGEANADGEAKADGENRGVRTPRERKISPRHRDSRDEPSDAILLADLKRRHPDIDPVNTHNIRDIQNPSDVNDRFDYTTKMTKVIDLWIASGNGAALSKILDEQSETKDRQAVFLTLHGYFFTYWPVADSTASAASAEKALLAANEVAPDFEVARTLLAYYYMRAYGPSKLAESEKLVNGALETRPGNIEAALLKCAILDANKKGSELKEFSRRTSQLPNISALELMAALSHFNKAEQDFEVARKFLNELMAVQSKPEHRAMVMMFLAQTLLSEGKLEDAKSLAKDSIAILDVARHADQIAYLHVNIIETAFIRETIAARDAKDTEKQKAAEDAREKLLSELLEFDLKHLRATDDTKGAALARLEEFLIPRGRGVDYLNILRRYDREAARLAPETREVVRAKIEELELIYEANIELTGLAELARSTNPTDHQKLAETDLARLIRLYQDAPEKYRFDKPETIELMVGMCAHTNRGVARRAMRLVAIGASQDKTDEARDKALAAISTRLASERALNDREVKSLVQDGVAAMLFVGKREGALKVAEWIAGLGDGIKAIAVRTDARSFAEKAVDAAGFGTDRKLREAAGDISSSEDAVAWAKELTDKINAAKAKEAADKAGE